MISNAQDYIETGKCSYYTDKWQGRSTASGERYDKDLYTAAHRTLPFNTLVKVTNIENNKSIVVRIIDRGPYIRGRILDVSGAAARELGMLMDGVAEVRLEYAGMVDADSLKTFMQSRPVVTVVAEEKKPPVMKDEVVRKPVTSVKPVFYDQEHKECVPRGFGVQVGSYSSYSNCRNAMNNLVAAYGAKAFMYVVEVKKTVYYKLLLGQFGTISSAESFKNVIRKDHPDSFIVSYSSL